MYPPPHQAPYTDGPTARQDARTMPNAAPQQALMPPPQRRSRIPALALGAYAAGLAGIVLAAVSLALLLTYKGQAQAQPDHMRQALTSTQSTLAKAQSGNAVKYTHLSGAVSSIENTLAPYSVICSTDLQGASGPAQYYFACSDQKP